MSATSARLSQLTDRTKRVGGRLLAIVENRVELLTVEVQEERDRLMQALLLALGLGVLGLLAGVALTAAVAVLFWEHSPLVALLILGALYAGGAACLYARLRRMLRDWETLPATLDQLRKDRECVERILD